MRGTTAEALEKSRRDRVKGGVEVNALLNNG